ncbi:hypothetical protein HDU93_007244, partial [Gonapodya sp. JEL0774]
MSHPQPPSSPFRRPDDVIFSLPHTPQSFPLAGKRTSRVFGTPSADTPKPGAAGLPAQSERRQSLSYDGYGSGKVHRNGNGHGMEGRSQTMTLDRTLGQRRTTSDSPQRDPRDVRERPVSFPSALSSSSPSNFVEADLPRPLSMLHDSTLPTTLLCPICSLPSPSLIALNTHLDLEHPSAPFPLTSPSSSSASQPPDDVADRLMGWFRGAQRVIAAPLSKVASEVGKVVDTRVAEEVFAEAKEAITNAVNGRAVGNINSAGHAAHLRDQPNNVVSESVGLGVARSRTQDFVKIRSAAVKNIALESNKIERRVEK